MLNDTEILDTLRLDADEVSNIFIAQSLVEAIPEYIHVATGLEVERLGADPTPLEKTTAKFILQLWYHPDNTDALLQQRTIDNLLHTLKNTRY